MISKFRLFLVALAALLSGSAAAESPYSAYLFAYFTGNKVEDESVHFAVSRDGFNFKALNGNRPVIPSAVISETGGVRDPHIMRSADGKHFYMVVTDMTSHKGWDSNRGLTLLKSDDLVNWSASVINIQKRYPGNENLKRVWAPQTIYDKDAKKNMVYWSMKHGDGPDIIYYAYANDDFTDFIGEPRQLFFPKDGKSCIDGDIVYKDGKYHMFYKTEGHGNGIKKATTKKLASGKWKEYPDYKQQTDKAVEGAGTFKLNDSDKYILMYDVYMDGKYQFTESSDLDKFKVVDESVSMDFKPRHGTVISITEDEYNRLQQAFPSVAVKEVPVGKGYSATSVNTAVFRGSSLVSDADFQYIAFYDPQGRVTVGKRRHGSADWTLAPTQYTGKVTDAHNVISLGIDGAGYLHLSFDHHGHPLRYARSVAPGSLQFGELESMTGNDEKDVTYPDFYTLADGNLLFAYRSGASGRGNLVLNLYDTKARQWRRLHDILIDGEGQRNAYWQLCTDRQGTIHLSWVWRETWLVETNHDLCYARSRDGGRTWERSDGTPYALPITAASAEVAIAVPQKSELINQTSMSADADGNPCIATYWRDADSKVPQFRMVWLDGAGWHSSQVGERTQPFSLSGGGTKMIPISRPVCVSCDKGKLMIFRDAERGSKLSLAYLPAGARSWQVTDLGDTDLDAWEPTIDRNMWQNSGRLNVFVQATHQGDGEKVSADTEPTMVSVAEIEF